MSPSGRLRNESASSPTASACARPARLRGGGGGEAASSPPTRSAVSDVPPQSSYKEAANLMSVSGNALINIISSFAVV